MPDYYIEPAALRFKAAGELASLISRSTIEFSNGFTLELWFKPESSGGRRNLLTGKIRGSVTSGSPASGLSISSYIAIVDVALQDMTLSISGTVLPAVTLKLGQWCHLAITVTSDQTQAFVQQAEAQAQQFTLKSLGGGRMTLTDLWLGERSEDMNPAPSLFDGAYAELRLWNALRSRPELDQARSRQLVGNEPGLIAYWMLNEGRGASLGDSTTNGSDGTVTGNAWVLNAGLPLMVFDAEKRYAFFASEKLAKEQTKLQEIQKRHDDLASTVAATEIKQQEQTALGLQQELKYRSDLELVQQKFRSRQAEIDKAKSEILKTLGATQQISLSKFIERLQDKLARSRAQTVGDSDTDVQGLDSVTLEVKMVPGYGGEGIQLPKPGRKTEQGRFSTLRLQLRYRPKAHKRELKLVQIPELAGCTEIYARRVLGSAGFRVDVMYQAAQRADQHGRVLELLCKSQEAGRVALDSIVTIIVGQRA